jgi:trimeric autotransporter adhesin
MADIRITPASSSMAFTSSLNFKETLTQDPSGSIVLQGSGSTGRTNLFAVDGNNGRLFSIDDDLSNSLFSVNTIAGLPVIEAFADNTVVMGQYGQNVLVVTGSSVGVGTSSPIAKFHVSGSDANINGVNIGRGGGNVSTNISIGATTNFSSSATGANNFAAGNLCFSGSLQANTTGANNTAIGLLALRANTTGTYNTAIGYSTLYSNTSGSNNIAFGQNAGCLFSGSSSNNIAIGFAAGPSTLTQESNKLYIASGSGTPLIKGDFAAKTVNISGSLIATSFTGSLQGTASFATNAVSASYAPDTTFPYTGSALITGSLGVTGSISTSGSNGTINGLFVSRGGGNVSSNISIGATTNFSSSATGIDNTAIGRCTLICNTTGANNTAIGYRALLYNTTGGDNTAIGYIALRCNTTGYSNTAIGRQTLSNNTSGCHNTAIGFRTLFSNTTGESNTAIGRRALIQNTTGTNNTAIGILLYVLIQQETTTQQ